MKMKRKSRMKRFLAFCMMACMVFTMMPLSARAETATTKDIYANSDDVNNMNTFSYESTPECSYPIARYVYGNAGDTYSLTEPVGFLLISDVEVTLSGDGDMAEYVIVGSGSLKIGNNSTITPTSPAASAIGFDDNAANVVGAFITAGDSDIYDLTVGDAMSYTGEFANITLNAQLTIPDDEAIAVIDSLTVNTGSLSGGGTLVINGATAVSGMQLYDSEGNSFSTGDGNNEDWYCFNIVEDKWTLQDDGAPANGNLRLELFDVGDSGYAPSNFQYKVGGGGWTDFVTDGENPMAADGDISAEGNVSIIINKINPEDDFWGFGYGIDGDEDWYNTVDYLRGGDVFENNVLTIQRTGTENIMIGPSINAPSAPANDLIVESESKTIDTNEEYDNVFVKNGYTLTIGAGTTLTVHNDMVLENGNLVVNAGGALSVGHLLIMDNNNGVINTVQGIALYENDVAVTPLNDPGTPYTVNDFKEFFYDNRPEVSKWILHIPSNDLIVESEDKTIDADEEYDNVIVKNGYTLTIGAGATLTVHNDMILENGNLVVNTGGNLSVEHSLIMDNNNSATNTVQGITLYESAESEEPIANNAGVYTFENSEEFFYDNRPEANKWIRRNGEPGEPGGPSGPGEPRPIDFAEMKKVLEEDWGTAFDANVDTMKTAFTDMLWDKLIHEWNGEDIYGDKNTFTGNVVVGNTPAGTETISGQNVSYYDVTITVPRPEEASITANTRMYALPTNYIMLEYIENNTKTKMLWDYTSVADLIAPGTDPNNFLCVGARISGRDEKTNVCFLQMEGYILQSAGMKNVRIFHSDYQGVKFDITDGKVAAQWGYFNHPYVDFGSTSVENPEKIIAFYGNSTLKLNSPEAVGTAGYGLQIDNVTVVSSSGIPANVIDFDNTNDTVTFNTDYYTEVPLKVEYRLTSGGSQTAYVTVERTGIHTNGWMRGGDKADNSTDTVLHGTGPGGEFNWGTDRYALFSTYYADGYDYSGYTASMYVKLTFADGSTETKTIPGQFFDGGVQVDSFDFQIYMGDAEDAPTHIEVIAYIEAADGSCSSAFTDAWDNTNE